MSESYADMSVALMLDGNAAAGLLAEIFGHEMTEAVSECAHCGDTGAMGRLHAHMNAPGVILRCPTCGEIILRAVMVPHAYWLDLRGAAVLRIARE